MFKKQVQKQYTMSSQPFVKFVNNKLTLIGKIDTKELENVRVVSILGKARMGKSTFLNAIISRLTGQNVNAFQTLDSLDHCTKGIDFYYVESHKILLLDSQGLAHQNSSHDPSLLLFLYLISDVIIFNERMMLQNEALKLMEPICAFMTYVDVDEIVKPKLFFRISDGDMIKNTEENLNTVMNHYDDQYQSIRESICHLFDPDLHLVKTDTLDKYAKNLLSQNDYIALLSRADLGFINAITEILENLPAANVKGMFNLNTRIPQILEQINNNEKIKIEKLDIVGMTAKTEIRDWIDAKIPREYYAPIEVDGTQKCYEEKVETRKNLKKTTLTAFSKQFKNIPATIVLPFRTKLDSDLAEPIKKATDDSIIKAEERVKGYVTKAFEDRILDHVTSQQKCLSDYLTNFKNTIFTRMNDLQNAVDSVYQPVKESHLALIEKLRLQFMKEVIKIKKEEEEEAKAVQEFLQSSLDGFFDEFRQFISTYDKETFIRNRNIDLLNAFINKGRNDIVLVLSDLIVPMSVHIKLVKQNIVFEKKKEVWQQGSIPIHHENVKGLLENYYNEIKGENSTLFQQINSYLIKDKNGFLFGKIMDRKHETIKIVQANNETIDFIVNNYIINKLINQLPNTQIIDNHNSPFVTRETYDKLIQPLLQKTFDRLVAQGFCTADCDIWSITKEQNNIFTYIDFKQDSLYFKHLSELYSEELKKVYCQEYVKGNITW